MSDTTGVQWISGCSKIPMVIDERRRGVPVCPTCDTTAKWYVRHPAVASYHGFRCLICRAERWALVDIDIGGTG